MRGFDTIASYARGMLVVFGVGCQHHAASAPACIDGSWFSVCFDTFPRQDLALAGTIETDTDARCEVQAQGDGGPDVCLIAATMIEVTSPLRPSGSRPLVLAAEQDVTVEALIDLDGGEKDAAAGANSGPCTTVASDMNGGGGGGGFAADGAAGGRGQDYQFSPAGSGPDSPVSVSFIRGGCDGASAGAGGSAIAGGTAGGAIYILAGNVIDVTADGEITAGGGGGRGGGAPGGGGFGDCGGGGGASGGLLAFDAPSVSVEGAVFATGGGGGGGGAGGYGFFPGSIGDAGQTGTLSGGAGGTAGQGGGDGGSGGGGSLPALSGESAPASGYIVEAGGGGGGGSEGVIVIHAMTTSITGQVSPAPVLR